MPARSGASPFHRVFTIVCGAAAILAGTLAAAPAGAQPKPPPPSSAPPPPPPPEVPPDGGDVSVPRGGSSAVITPPEQPGDGARGSAPRTASLPRPLNYAPPRYPAAAEKAGLEATVTLQLDIDQRGRVTKAFVVDPAGHGFDESALEAAQKLEFDPARRADGTPHAARILYRYSFALTTRRAPGADAGGPGGGQSPGSTPGGAAEETIAETLSGTILLRSTEIPVAGATITARGPDGKDVVATADASGRFHFNRLAPGSYRVTIRARGYESLEVDERLSPDEPLEVRYRLIVAGGGLEVTVRGPRPPREVVKRTLQQREIDRIPGTNGDALRSVQSLPGVARIPGGIGLLIVRGSAAGDTQTFIDGTPVPLIYHFGGLSSVVPTELVEKIDFYPGNFSAQYGRAQGGIVDAGLRSPRSDGKYHGLVQVDLIDARALLEGPVPLFESWRFAAAGRRSYIDAWLGPVLDSQGAGATQAPVYYDYQFLLETTPSPASRLRLSFFGSDDGFKLIVPPNPRDPAFSGNFDLHTAFQRVQLLYENDAVGGDDTRLRGVFALGRDNVDFGLGSFYFLLEVLSVTSRLEVSRRISQGVTLNAGFDLLSGVAEVSARAPSGPVATRSIREITLDQGVLQPAAHVELEIVPHPRAKIVPGVRIDYFNVNNRTDLSPRVNARYDLIQGYPRTTAKAGAGIFHQPPAFQQSVEPIGNSDLRSSTAIHYALGLEQDVTRRLEASAEAFYKDLENQIDQFRGPEGTNFDNARQGYAVGGEFLLKYKPDERFFGWAAYTLSRSAFNEREGLPERLISFDQTHILTVLGSYRLGGGWEFGARFRLVSGNLTTPNICDVSTDESCDPNRTSALFYAPTGTYVPIAISGPATERLPLFHQLDLRVDKRWKFKSWQLSAYLDVQNVYNRANSEGISYNYNFTGRQYVKGLPILPSLGLRGDF